MSFEPPTEEEKQRVREELGTDESSIQQAVSTLADWLLAQPHLPPTLDNGRIERLYINCKCRFERTKHGLDNYFSLRTLVPHLMSKRDPKSPEIQDAMTQGKSFPMPRLTPSALRVVVTTDVVPDARRYSPLHTAKLFLMTHDVRFAEEYNLGDIYIIDAGPITMAHIAAISVSVIRDLERCLKTAYCNRIKGIHFINAPRAMDVLLNLVLGAISPKLGRRVYVHTRDSETLFDHVPREYVPNELGGTAGNVDDFWVPWLEKVCSYRQWFLDQDKIRSDESKRPLKGRIVGDLFGVEGSFKRLTID